MDDAWLLTTVYAVYAIMFRMKDEFQLECQLKIV